MDPDAQALIARFHMVPIPREGGWFCETWRSPITLPAGSLPGYQVDKPAGTAILALFCADRADGFSALHRLATTEVWHFCGGDPFRLLLVPAAGEVADVVLGPNMTAGDEVQIAVPPGTWMGGQVAPQGRFSLLGCTMAPGFTPEDYEAGRLEDQAALTAAYPDREAEIARLIRA
jgi:predicted cupin superfamily sugar epimerase